jgi:hypothetical protein
VNIIPGVSDYLFSNVQLQHTRVSSCCTAAKRTMYWQLLIHFHLPIKANSGQQSIHGSGHSIGGNQPEQQSKLQMRYAPMTQQLHESEFLEPKQLCTVTRHASAFLVIHQRSWGCLRVRYR